MEEYVRVRKKSVGSIPKDTYKEKYVRNKTNENYIKLASDSIYKCAW